MKHGNHSFATKLGNGNKMLKAISEMAEYNPPRSEESINGFSGYLKQIEATNAAESNMLRDYTFLVDERQKVFFLNTDSLEKKFLSLKNAVISQYGKKSQEIKILKRIHNRMTFSKVTKIEETVTSENENAETALESPKGRSGYHAEKTYASLVKNLSDFVTTIEGFNSYQPGIEELNLENLQKYFAYIQSLHNDVIEKQIKLSNIKHERKQQYAELKDRGDRIKFYVKSKYGANSQQYDTVRSIKL